MIGIEWLELGRMLFSALTAVSIGAAVLAALAWAATVVLRPRSAASEHGVWAAALTGLAILPAALGLAAILPVAGVDVPALHVPALDIPLLNGAVLGVTETATTEGAEPAPSTAAASSAGLDWRAWLGLGWLAVAALLLLRAGAQTLQARGLLRRARAVEPSLPDRFREEVRAARASLVESAAVDSPAVIGVLRPTIVLPESWRDWSEVKLRSVLLHEFAHVARGDGRTFALARAATTLLWFHPAAYWLHAKLRSTAEHACDDHAVFLSGDREGYAQALLEIASVRAAATPAGALAMASGSRVGRRIDRIIAASATSSGLLSPGARRASTLVSLCVAVLLALASVAVAQSGGATLSGSVLDPSGARTPNAVIVLVNEETGKVEATSSGADGAYRITGLEASTEYVIEVRGQGFAALTDRLEVDGDTTFDPRLSIRPVEEEILVSGTRQARTTTGSRTRTRIGGRVDRAKMTKYVEPIYPPAAEREGVEGTVLLQATISVEGVPTDVRTVNTLVDERLAEAARTAVRQWRYEPVKLNGEAVPIGTVMSVAFQLP